VLSYLVSIYVYYQEIWARADFVPALVIGELFPGGCIPFVQMLHYMCLLLRGSSEYVNEKLWETKNNFNASLLLSAPNS
jgi:hypothetical protein